jgi:mannosyltransferase
MIKRIPEGTVEKFIEIEQNARLQYLLLLLITILACALRFYKLGEWSFWIDEIKTIDAAQDPAVNNFSWPSISLMLIGTTLKVLGISEWSARLTPAVIGILTIPILYLPIRKLFGAGVALIASILLAVSPWHLFWSQNARFYTSLMLLYTLALLFFYFALEEDRPGYILLSLFLLALAAVERFIALFFVPVVLIYLLLLKIVRNETPPGLRERNLVFMALAGIVIGILEVYSLASTGGSRFFGSLEWFFIYRIDDPFRLLSFISFSIGIPLMCFAFFGGVYLLAQKNRAGLFLFIAAVVPVVLLLLLNPFIFTKDRYIFIALPSWIILGAVGINEILAETKNPGKVLALGLLFVFLADAAGSNLLYYQVNNGNRRDWKGAFTTVKKMSNNGDEYVSFWPDFGPYYLGHRIIPWETIDSKSVIESGKRFWFVLDSETVWANSKMKSWVERNAELVEVMYLRTPDDFYLRIYLYDPLRHGAALNGVR